MLLHVTPSLFHVIYSFSLFEDSLWNIDFRWAKSSEIKEEIKFTQKKGKLEKNIENNCKKSEIEEKEEGTEMRWTQWMK